MSIMKSFKVYKSSAGSGKTYTIVREYLSLALGTEQSSKVKNILAITFTNNSASEMKERIIKMLYEFSSGEPKGTALSMFNELQSLHGISPLELQKRALQTLKYILHHYTSFSVSTIDKFNHKIIRSFAFDLGLSVNFSPETDATPTLRDTVDELLGNIGEQNYQELTKILISFVEDLLEKDKGWNIQKKLLEFSKQLLEEKTARILKSLSGIDIKGYIEISQSLGQYINQYKKEITQIGEKGIQVIEDNHIEPDLLAGGANAGVKKYFSYLQNFKDDSIVPKNSIANYFANGKLYSSKAKAEQIKAIEAISTLLTQYYNEAQKIITQKHSSYLFYKNVKDNIYTMALYNELDVVFSEQKKANNILFISEFNKIISAAVTNEPVPFIYEKIGEKYHHFLIDEFQDTSSMQWQNILPLMHNSLSQGIMNMIVGDAKQSIYRWRNSQVEQFVQLPQIYKTVDDTQSPALEEQEKALKNNYIEYNLDTNYRSKKNIIDFNNDFFNKILETGNDKIKAIYQQVKQKPQPNNTGGTIHYTEYMKNESEESKEEWMCRQTLEIINLCKQKGYSQKDIAVICRKNKEGAQIATYLLENNIDVISKESLLLSSSPEVKIIMEIMKLLNNPNNEISVASIKYYFKHKHHFNDSFQGINTLNSLLQFFEENNIVISINELMKQGLYEICNSLCISLGLNRKPNVYLQFFLDNIYSFGQETRNIDELLDWWEDQQDTLSICIPEGEDAVNILTINTSKGLQFPVVIVPGADLTGKQNDNKLWINLKSKQLPLLNGLNYAYANFIRGLEQTDFADQYREESEKILLDDINLLYVAFTRPEDHLFILSLGRNTFSQVASKYLVPYFNSPSGFEDVIINKQTFKRSGGEIAQVNKNTKAPKEQLQITNITNHNWKNKLETENKTYNTHWQQEQILYGNMVHLLLSEINTDKDIEKVIYKYKFNIEQGGLQVSTLKEKLHEVLNMDTVKKYYDGKYSLKRENSIIDEKGTIYRPDLIAIKEKQAVIIDYKTGIPQKKYAEQINNYALLLEKMGYQIDEKLIIYTDDVQVEKVV